MTKQINTTEKAAKAPKQAKVPKTTKTPKQAKTALPDPPAEIIVDIPEQEVHVRAVITADNRFNSILPEQAQSIATQVDAMPTRAEFLKSYGDSSVASAFARDYASIARPELMKFPEAPKPSGNDPMVFCDMCGCSVPKSETVVLAGKTMCKDLNTCRKAKADPKTQTLNIVKKQEAKAEQKAEKTAKTATSGRAWPWPDHAIVVVLNSAHGRNGVRGDIFNTICAAQTIGELKAKTFSQRGGTHKIPVADVIAAVGKKNISIVSTAEEAGELIHKIAETDTTKDTK